jgi:hypothetical protein
VRTTVINLWAGPGAGKSTTAAQVFARLKAAGHLAELVTEYVKNWAWQGRVPGHYEDVYLFAKQLQRESVLYGKVDYIITDSPIGLGAIYAQGSQVEVQRTLAMNIRARQIADGIKHVDCILRRTKEYVPHGRYETPAQALCRDADVRTWVPVLAKEWRLVTCADGVLAAAGVVA